jgi:hypothetical protein
MWQPPRKHTQHLMVESVVHFAFLSSFLRFKAQRSIRHIIFIVAR